MLPHLEALYSLKVNGEAMSGFLIAAENADLGRLFLAFLME